MSLNCKKQEMLTPIDNPINQNTILKNKTILKLKDLVYRGSSRQRDDLDKYAYIYVCIQFYRELYNT